METNIEMNPVYCVRLTRVEAARALVDPKAVQVALRDLLSPDGAEKVVQAISAVANGHRDGGTVKALPAGPAQRKTRRVALAHKKGGPRPGVKQQCKYCDRKIAPWRMSTHVAAYHPEAPASEKPGGQAEPGQHRSPRTPASHFPLGPQA